MKQHKLYAIITGDLVQSSKITGKEKEHLLQLLKTGFAEVKKGVNKTENLPSFSIFRGDSFQGMLPKPVDALWAGLYIRALLRKHQAEITWDARMAIGVGAVDYLPETISEGDGPAYRNSGPVLDQLKGDHKLAITTPWDDVNDEFETSCSLLDAVIQKWTPAQAEVVYLLLQDKIPKEMSQLLNISQAAIHYRVKGAGWFAIERMLQRYRNVISNKKSYTS